MAKDPIVHITNGQRVVVKQRTAPLKDGWRICTDEEVALARKAAADRDAEAARLELAEARRIAQQEAVMEAALAAYVAANQKGV